MITMPAITQPRSFGPYVGRRYGSFADKDEPAAPDFMHGTLDIYLSLSGEIKMWPSVSGEIYMETHVKGDIGVNP